MVFQVAWCSLSIVLLWLDDIICTESCKLVNRVWSPTYRGQHTGARIKRSSSSTTTSYSTGTPGLPMERRFWSEDARRSDWAWESLVTSLVSFHQTSHLNFKAQRCNTNEGIPWTRKRFISSDNLIKINANHSSNKYNSAIYMPIYPIYVTKSSMPRWESIKTSLVTIILGDNMNLTVVFISCIFASSPSLPRQHG